MGKPHNNNNNNNITEMGRKTNVWIFQATK